MNRNEVRKCCWSSSLNRYGDPGARDSGSARASDTSRHGNCHIAPKWGGTDMGDITPDAIEDWLWDFDKPGAARKAWSVLRSILRLAVRKGCLDTDPTRREITMPHQPRYDAPVLDAGEVRRLLRGFYGHELEAWLLCAVCAGLRREEACGLEWSDIDLRRGVIHIRRGLQWVDGHEVVAPPKTDLSSSDVQLPSLRRQASRRTQAWTVGQAHRRSDPTAGRPTLSGMVQTRATAIRAPEVAQAHVGNAGHQERRGHQRGRQTAQAHRYQDHRSLLFETRHVDTQGCPTQLRKAHHRMNGFP